MQRDYFRALAWSWKPTVCPRFPPVQHYLTAPAEDPSALKAPVKAFTDFTMVEGWADIRGSVAAINNVVLLSFALSSLTVGKDTFESEDVEKVARFISALLQLCQPVAITAGWKMAWATMGHRAMWLSHTLVPDRNRAWLIQGPLSLDGLFRTRFAE
ncbi:unnamed protein product [Merluccius merluccius]